MARAHNYPEDEEDWADGWGFDDTFYNLDNHAFRVPEANRHSNTPPYPLPTAPFHLHQASVNFGLPHSAPNILAQPHLRTFPPPHHSSFAPRPQSAAQANDHSDAARVNSFGYIPDHLFDEAYEDLSEDSHHSPESAPSPPSDHQSPDSPQEIQNSDEEQDGDNMPAATRGCGQSQQADGGEGVVDLTTSSPPQMRRRTQPVSRKRSAESSQQSGPSSKRSRLPQDVEAEALDLTGDNEAPTAEEELQQAELQQAVANQQREGDNKGPVKIGQKTCIICMENYTNATVTTCGHIYCHECLIQALTHSAKSNDRNTGNCPACRKPIYIMGRRKETQILPIAFMKKSEFKGKRPRLAT